MTDFELNNNDIVIRNGDFSVANSDYDDIALMLESAPGYFRQYPLVGVNVQSWNNGKINLIDKSELKKQLSIDGFNVQKITIENNQLIINASRT